MAERYTRLYTLPENLYTEGAPLVIAAGALLKDNQTGKVLAQLKYRSICSRPIRAIKVLITGYDMAKAVVCQEEHQYLDLEIGRDEYWGSKEAVYLPDRSVRSYSAAVLAVYYADGGSYVSDSQRWEPLQEQAGLDTKLWDKELAKQYRIDTTPKSVFVPMRQKDLWLCACGEINRDGERCHVCSQELDTLIAKLDVDRLREEKTERLRREEEHASAVDAVRDAHAKKAKKIALIAAPIAVIAAAAIVFSVVSSKNARAYDDALALLDAGRYNEADVAFTKLGNYKDSAEKAEEAAGKGQENAKKAAFLKAELEVRLDKADLKSRREAERIIADARATAEQVFAELDEMRKAADKDQDAQRVNEARAQLRRQLNLSEQALQKELTDDEADKVSARPVKVGDVVKIKSMGVKATVITKSPDGVLSLRAGIMNVSAKEDEVLLLEGEKAPETKSSAARSSSQLRNVSVASEIDLRGMETIEGVLAAERYIDSAVMGKLKTVTIIHGKGTGALRAAVQQMLKKNKSVKSFRLGRFGEGEAGVTVVELK